jgi:hypothetical protein
MRVGIKIPAPRFELILSACVDLSAVYFKAFLDSDCSLTGQLGENLKMESMGDAGGAQEGIIGRKAPCWQLDTPIDATRNCL